MGVGEREEYSPMRPSATGKCTCGLLRNRHPLPEEKCDWAKSSSRTGYYIDDTYPQRSAPPPLTYDPASVSSRIDGEMGVTGLDMVNTPPHYTSHPSGVECITITEHMNFCRGNALKYIWRAGEKGCELQDLRKARWYLDREIARLSADSGEKEET